jgi:hypothetical protein
MKMRLLGKEDGAALQQATTTWSGAFKVMCRLSLSVSARTLKKRATADGIVYFNSCLASTSMMQLQILAQAE